MMMFDLCCCLIRIFEVGQIYNFFYSACKFSIKA